jgi:hypothetical protein
MKLSLSLMANMEDTGVYGKEDESEDVPSETSPKETGDIEQRSGEDDE